MKDLFKKYQKGLLKLANNRFGRKLLSIDTREKIVGITDNAFAVEAESKLKAEFRCYPVYAKRIGAALVNWDESKQWLKGNKELYKGLTDYKGLLNYCGILNSREFPAVMAASPATVYVNDAGGNGVINSAVKASWALARAETTGTVRTGNGTERCFSAFTNFYVTRWFAPFNLSAIPSGNKCDAAVSSLCSFNSAANANTINGVVTECTQADGTTLATGDFDNLTLDSPTELAPRADLSTWTGADGTYYSFTFNADGKTACAAKFGTWFMLVYRSDRDIDNSAPSVDAYTTMYTADTAGTTKDAKLVVTYTPSAGFLVFM